MVELAIAVQLSGSTSVSEGGVSSDTVVKDVDVFEQALTSFGAGFVLFVVDEFFLQSGEEGFHRGEECYRPAACFLATARRPWLLPSSSLCGSWNT